MEQNINQDIQNKEVKPKKTRHDYYLKFKENNNEKIHEKKVCEVCFGTYTYFNKSRHFKSKWHLRRVELNHMLPKKNTYKDLNNIYP